MVACTLDVHLVAQRSTGPPLTASPPPPPVQRDPFLSPDLPVFAGGMSAVAAALNPDAVPVFQA